MKGHLHQRSPGSYTLWVELSPDPATGKRRQKTRTIHVRTKREAQAILTDWLAEIQSGAYVPPTELTVAQFLARWLRDYARPGLRPTTYASYEQLMRCHILPTLGNVALGKLRTTDLQELYAAKLIDGRADGKPDGLSPRSVRYLHSVIREALGHAVKWRLLKANVADNADPPRTVRHEVQTWTPEVTRRFLADMEKERLYALYLLALTTGMRRGELLGLRWQDVDLEHGLLAIRQARLHASGGPITAGPKGGRTRSVAIGAAVNEALDAHRRRQQSEKELFGVEYRESGYVFTVGRGTPLSPRNVSRHFENRVRKLGLPRIRFHDLRHTLATALLAAGEHPKVVAERLGHSQVRVTMDTYSHVLPGIQREAARHAEDMLLGELRGTKVSKPLAEAPRNESGPGG